MKTAASLKIESPGIGVSAAGIDSIKREAAKRYFYLLSVAGLLAMALLFHSLFNVTALDKARKEALVDRVGILGAMAVASISGNDGRMAVASPISGFDRAAQRLFAGAPVMIAGSGVPLSRESAARLVALSLVTGSGDVLNRAGGPVTGAVFPQAVTDAVGNVMTGDRQRVDLQGITYLVYPATGRADGEDPADAVAWVLSFSPDAPAGPVGSFTLEHARHLGFVFFGGLLLFIVVLRTWAPVKDVVENSFKAKFTLLIVMACIVAQLFYSAAFLAYFVRDLILENQTTLDRVEEVVGNRILAEVEASRGAVNAAVIQGILEDTQRAAPMIESISVAFDGAMDAFTVGRYLPADRGEEPVNTPAMLFPLSTITRERTIPPQHGAPVRISARSSSDAAVGTLVTVSLDCLTVSVISIMLMLELLYLLNTFFYREKAAASPTKAVDYKRMRPAIFLLLFAIDLSMSFIPLHMGKLYEPIFGLSRDIVMGLPITTEFIFVGMAILISGFWLDRRGWHEAFIVGLFLSIVGIFYSWLAPGPVHFIVARAFVGSGYGLALMASQGFVIRFTDARTKAQGLAHLFAGIYAGSICGGATGAMIADRYNYRFVFLIGGIIVFFILAYTFTLMREAMIRPEPLPQPARAESMGQSAFARFFRNRVVLGLIFFSSLPASIAVVGFLNYFSPVYLNSLGMAQSNIGRVLMIYGISLVFLGPFIGRYIDRSQDKKYYVFVGCLLGAATFLVFHLLHGILAATAGVLLLGLSSSFVLAGQSAYLLNLKVTKNFGEGKSIGIFRSSSRIGQALGPLVFGALMLTRDMEEGIRVFGMIYLATAFIFLLFTNRDRKFSLQD